MAGNEELTQTRAARRFLLWGLAAVGLIVAALLIVRVLFPGLPQIGDADVDAAEKRWEGAAGQNAAVQNYDIGIRLAGRQTGELRCRVRDGRAVGLSRNGYETKEERTWHPWTVPGMFETLRTDLENARHPAAQFGSAEVKVVLRVEFDPQYGYPRRYLQQVFGRLDDLTWEVFEFSVK